MHGVQFGESGMNVSGKPVSVLLVEDEGLIAEMISMALEDRGYDVCIAASAAEALDCLEAGAIDILFTDINLPGDMDGADLAARAREMKPDLPVIYASGRWGLLEKLQSVPHSAILPKPYSLTRALETVELLVGRAAHLNA